MARITLNPAIRLISGQIAGYIYRHHSDGRMTLATMPLPNPGRQRSPAQLAQLQRFKQAAARWRSILEDPGIKAAYQRLCLERGSLARINTLVIGDVMKPPRITLIDLSNYHGSPGDTIRVKAEDNLAVARISLVIHDLTAGCEVETGEDPHAFQHLAPTVEWLYTVRLAVPLGHAIEIRVTASDLAGNQCQVSQLA